MADKELEARRDERRRMMLEDPIIKVIPIVAIPMIISMLIDSIYNIADTYFVSRLGTAATAAVGVNDSLMHFMRSVAMGFGMGASSYISRLMGAKNEDEASKVASTTFFTALIFLSAVAALAYVFMSPLVTLLGATESVKPYSIAYAKFILLSAPFTAGEVVLSQLLRSEGSTKFSMIGMVSGCVLNIALDPIFIHVLSLGVSGAAIATTISKCVSFMVLLTPFLRRRTMLEVKFKYFTPKWEIYKEVAKMGIPTFLRSSMMSVASVVTNNVAGSFSDSALAAVSVANKCTRLVASAVMGFGQGFQPVAGYCWGAKRYKRVHKAFWTTSAIGAVCGGLLGIIMGIFSKQLIGIFASSEDTEIIRIGSLMIISQCITMIPHVWVMIANGLFQALGRAVSAGVLGLSRQVICLIPCVVILSKLFGVNGLAVAQASADVLSCLIALPMVLKLTKEIKAKESEQEINPELQQ
jgi:putative MATE family efflux protein